MAPILLKIKGTKLFSPFDEIDDVNDLSTLWRVCTKVKDSLENGSRLENLSWRLWHLHQLLEARGKGKDYRKLSPATTMQLEKTIRRPDFIRKTKPVQIKVRLGKAGDRLDRAEAQAAELAPSPANGRARASNANRSPQRAPAAADPALANTAMQELDLSSHGALRHAGNKSNRAAAVSAAAASTSKTRSKDKAPASQHTASGRPAGPSTAHPESLPSDGSGPLDELDTTSAIAVGVGVPSTANDSAVDDALTAAGIGPLSNNKISNVSAMDAATSDAATSGASALASTSASASASASNAIDGGVSIASGHGHGFGASPNTQLGSAAAGAEEVQASDFMSFGPSSFLSSGFDLDPPQIEITLDDIFSANSADWSQFGFASLGGGPTPGLPMSDFAGGQGMWNGMPYPGPMPMGAPYGMGQHMPMQQEQTKKHDGPICDNCGVTSTPLWRRSVDETLLCNACGLYYKLHHTHRPKSLRSNSARKDGMVEEAEKTECTNCKTTTTPLWRRDEKGNPLCNACGLYYKLHKENRPISLKTDVIRKRQRYDTSSSMQRKRQDRSNHKQGGGASASPNTSSSSSSSTPAAAPTSAGATKGTQSSRSKNGVQKLAAPDVQVHQQQQDHQFETLTPSSFAVKQEQHQEKQPHLMSPSALANNSLVPSTAGSSAMVQEQQHHHHQYHQQQPSAPFTAPLVSSYTANGTQLLNNADAGSSSSYPRHSHNSPQQQQSMSPISPASSQQQQRSRYPLSAAGLVQSSVNGDYRRHSTIPELPSISSAHGVAVPSDSHQPALSLQHSSMQPVNSHGVSGAKPGTSSTGTTNKGGSGDSGGSRGIGGSINIPMSPPIVSRSDSYFSRTASITGSSIPGSAQSPASQTPLPPLGPGQDGRYGGSGPSSFAGTGSLHGASSLQPSASGQAYRQQMQVQQPSSSQRPPLAQAQTAHIPTSSSKHDPGRQLPSLAELASASAVHNGDALRLAHSQQPHHHHHHQSQQQQQYPHVNP